MNDDQKQLLLYMVKCLVGSSIVFLTAYYFDYHDISWCLISVLLVLTPDSNEAVPLALTRIKANFVGVCTSLLCLLLVPGNYVTISLAMVLTIGLCYLGRLMAGCRSALAAVVIILLHSANATQQQVWLTAGQRLASVSIGCVLALGITLVFHRNYPKLLRRSETPAQEA